MTNQEYLAAVASALGPLVAEVVFTGGLVVQEYWTIPALREPRATVDADVIVEAATYTEYAAFGKRLRERVSFNWQRMRRLHTDGSRMTSSWM